MPKRDDWIFEYSVKDVEGAALRKFTFHEAREKHWQDKEAEAQVDLKEHGIDFREEALAGSAMHSNTGYRQEPTLDQEKVKNLREAQTKVKEHRVERIYFQRWVQVFSREKKDRVLELQFEDVVRFELAV